VEIFMTSAMAAGAVVVFLVVCVWHNRRTGYQRMRDEKITLGEAVAQIRQSLALSHHASPAMAQTEQLLKLSSVLEYRRQTQEMQPEEAAELTARK
jgi:hypothetical protein